MIIDNPEQFKAWLTAVLEPLCDADPAALAKYVYALVKKDKTLDELRGGMVEQLDVFLQHETKSFVELLFKTLETQKYELPLPKIDSTIGGTTPPCINTPSNLQIIKTENIDIQIPIVPIISSPPLQQQQQQQTIMPLQINGSSIMPLSSLSTTITPTQQPLPPPPPTLSLPPTSVIPLTTSPTIPIMIKRENRKSESEKDDKDKRPRSRGRLRSKTRSRSRSWERDRRRSRSRDHIRRDRERDRSRPWRNKSPPSSSVRRHDRRRSRSRSLSPLRTRNTRDIVDNRDHRSRFRNRSPSPLRSSSRSIERKKLDKLEPQQLQSQQQQQQQHSPDGTIIQDSNHGDIDMRSSSSTSQPVRSVVIAPPFKNNNNNNQQQQTTNDNFQQQKRRCRDFDEKGYCMRGDLCPYDHGTDPVVLEDVALSRVLTFGPHGGPTTTTQPIVGNVVNDTQQPGHNGNSQPPHLPLSTLPPLPHLRNQHHANMGTFAEYNPDAPSMEPRGLPWPRHPGQAPGIYGRGQRELISVPVIPHPNQTDINHHQQQQQQQQQHQQQQQQQQQQQINPLKRKQAFDFNRLGPKQRAIHNSLNCSLELKKVPRILNNITQLNNHFSKFGKIVNIQVNFCGDPEAALVTFQLPAEAKAAYRSTEAVLNNRFIKVFWHNTANNNNINNNSNTNTSVIGGGVSVGAIENVPPGSCRPSVKERLGAAVTLPIKSENNEYVPTRRSTDEQSQVQSQQQQTQQTQQQATQNIVQSAQKLTTTTGPTREDKVLAIKKTQEILAAKETIKKKQEESRKEAIKLTADLRKRKGELLEKNLNEIRVLIDKAEKNPEQKDAIMTTIKILQQSIDELRKDLSINNGQTTTTTTGVQTNNNTNSNNSNNNINNNSNIKTQIKTREQTQKEILDAELDLMTAQQEGQDAGELQKRLNELKLQAAVLGISTGTAVARSVKTARVIRGGHSLTYRGGRGGIGGSGVVVGRGSYAHVSVDHRPTSLLISGYESDDKTEVLAHFQQYGEIVNQIVDDATPSIVINYKSRKEAEVALIKGRTFQDRLLSVTWVSSHHLHRGAVGNTVAGVGGAGGGGGGSVGSVGNNNTNSALSVRTEQTQITDEDIDLESAAEALLLEENEEEEEEDGEPRSWRR